MPNAALALSDLLPIDIQRVAVVNDDASQFLRNKTCHTLALPLPPDAPLPGFG